MSRARVRVKASAQASGHARRQASADITRKKAKQKRSSALKKRAMIVGVVLSVSYIGFGGWWLHSTGKIDKALKVTHNAWWGMTARAGFAVKQVSLEGREHIALPALKEALAINQGDPILAVDMQALQTRLMALPEMRSVNIARVLPNEMRVMIEERQPIALWQRSGAYAVVDRDGVVLNRKTDEVPKGLLLVVGEDAPKHIAQLMALLDGSPSMRSEVESAVRVGERRWNVRLRQDITVMLPEENAAEAWKKFVVLAHKDALLSKAIRLVDLRLEDRVVVTPLADPESPKIYTSARET